MIKFSNMPINLAGNFKMTMLRDNGEVISVYEEPNKIILPTITKYAKHILGLQEYEDSSLYSIKLGNGGVDEDGAFIEPTGKETDLKSVVSEYQFNKIPGNLTDASTSLNVASTIQIKRNSSDDVSYKVEILFVSKDANDPDTGGAISYSEKSW